MSYDFELGSTQNGVCRGISSYPTAFGWSMSCWFRLESMPDIMSPFSLNGAGDGNVFAVFRIQATGTAEFMRSGTAGNIVTIPSAVSLSTGTWYLATYAETSRTSRKLWINATEATAVTDDLAGDWLTGDLADAAVGSTARRDADGSPHRFFDGMVAEAAIWPSTILTQANVDSLYAGALASSVAGGPSMWWRLNSDKGTSSYAADTGTGTLTLSNSPVYSATHPTLNEGAQILLPASDITTTGWTASGGGALYAAIDESVASDTDYITTGTLNAECEVKLQAGSTPGAGSKNLKVRCPAGFTPVGNWSVSLYEGASLVQAFTTPAPTADTTVTFSVTNAITDYSDLRVRIKTTA